MATEAVLGIAQIPIRAVLDELDKDLAGARGKIQASVSGIAKMVGALGIGLIAKEAIKGVSEVARAVAGIVIDAAPVQGLKDAFGGLATDSGQSADALMAALKKGSSGMIAQRDLMASYNQAAQLVGTTFANQLPDAMAYLGKVSAATGQDMGFLLDSLVKGVGRLSPMILDNLAIQVSQAEATERAASMYGVEADALSKAQLQAGMMSVVMEKLAANTAAMPDVSESAAAGLARVKATMQDVKDQIGMALLPALSELLGAFTPLLEMALPMVAQLMAAIGPVVTGVAQAFGGFISNLTSGMDPLASLEVLLHQLFPAEVAKGITDAINWVVTAIQRVIEVVGPYVQQAAAWIAQNVQLKDVLLIVGAVLAGVVVSALVSLLAPIAGVVAAAAGLIAIVTLLRTAWESDFLGIRTFVMETLDGIKAFWTEHGEAIMATVQKLWDFVMQYVDFAFGNLKLLLEAFKAAFSGDWYTFGEKLREIWDRLWTAIKEIGKTAWDAIKKFFTETDWGAVGKAILEGVAKGITGGVKLIIDAAKNAAKAALEAAKGFLGIRSPSAAFELVGARSIQGWAKGLMQTEPLTAAITAAAQVTLAGAGGAVAPSEYHLHIYSASQAENLRGDFETLRAMAGA